MSVRLALACCIAASILAQSNAVQAQPENFAADFQALLAERNSLSAAERKIESSLFRAAQPMHLDLQAPIAQASGGGADYVAVDITGVISVAVINAIATYGGTVRSSFPEQGWLRADVPAIALTAIAQLADVRAILPAFDPISQAVNISEGDAAHRTNFARPIFGANGSGQKVGVISDGVGSLAAVQATGDLPATVNVIKPHANPDLKEGTAMLEIVHDLAPAAELLFASGFEGQADMADSIRALAAAGANIIVDDLAFPDAPVFQDGPVAQAVEEVTAGGVLYISSAGNWGNRTANSSSVWEGDFHATTVDGVVMHDFGAGNLGNGINWGGQLVLLPNGQLKRRYLYTLRWADPWNASANNYDICVTDASFHIGPGQCSENVQNGTGAFPPFEFLQLFVNADIDPVAAGFRIVVVRHPGAANRFFSLWEVVNKGPSFHPATLAFTTHGSIFGHPAATNAVAVGAVDLPSNGPIFDGGEQVSPYSADGNRRVFFLANGTPITPGNFSSTGGMVRIKPDLMAAAGVSTATPGFSSFYGTSASAPHVAGIAALVWDGAANRANTMEAMFSAVIDIGATGFDRDAGAGILDGFVAVDLVASPVGGTPIITSAGAKLYAILPGGSALQQIFTHDGTEFAPLPTSLRALALKGTNLFSSSTIGTSSTEMWKTDMIFNQALRAGSSTVSNLNAVSDLIFVGSTPDPYATVATPSGSTPACSSLNGRIVLVDRNTGLTSLVSSGGHLCFPHDVAASNGQLFVTEPNWPEASYSTQGVGAIIKVDPATGAQSVFSQGGTNFVYPKYLTKLSNGDLAVVAATSSTLSQWRLVRINGSTGTQTVIGALGANPVEIAVDGSAAVLVAYGQGPLERVNLTTGARTTLLASAVNIEDVEVIPQGTGGPACGLGAEVLLAFGIIGILQHRTARRREVLH